MPKFLTPSGSPCTADEAKPLGRLRPGYSEVISDGESIGFDMAFMDSAQRSSPAVYLTDSNERAAIEAEVERQHAMHDHKFAFMGDAAPKFDRERALLVARTKKTADTGAVIRDAVRDGRRASQDGITVAGRVPANGITTDDGKSLRDHYLRARFAR